MANPRLTHKEIMEILWGLLLALFVAMMSVTVVGTALPTMMAALHGTETHYAWVVTAMLLASTATTPIAGRLGDQFDKKKLLLGAIGIFTVGSLLSGAAVSANMLIGTRVLQGIGMGAQMSMVQTVIASIIPPRQRGRYNGYMGAVMAVATVSGPLVGGFIVATPWLGWRWSMWISVPFSILAMIILAKRLHLVEMERSKPHVDYWGSILITLGVSAILIWLSLGGKLFEWTSLESAVLIAVGVIATVAFIWVETKAREPIVPLRLFKQPTTALAIIASIAVGTALNAPPVFLGQYFQVGRGLNPAIAGLAMLPLMLGTFVFSTGSGLAVSRMGRWKGFVVAGLAIMTVGLVMMTFADYTTPMWYLWLAMFLIGGGQGASMQNLVLAVQNTVPLRDLGASTATVVFFRSLGGAVGVQIAGIAFANAVTEKIHSGFRAAGMVVPSHVSEGASMSFDGVPPRGASIIRMAYGNSIGIIFLTMAIAGVIAVVMALVMKGSELSSEVDNG